MSRVGFKKLQNFHDFVEKEFTMGDFGESSHSVYEAEQLPVVPQKPPTIHHNPGDVGFTPWNPKQPFFNGCLVKQPFPMCM